MSMVLNWIHYVINLSLSPTPLVPCLAVTPQNCALDFGEQIYKDFSWIFENVYSNQMKMIKTGCKISNNDIKINLQIVETIFWH